jgi:hypothetical protein
MRRISLSALVVLVVLAACGGNPAATPGASSSAISPTPVDTSAAAAALDHLLERLEAIHPEPFHGVDRDAFVAELDALKARLPELAPEEAMVELMRVVALLSAAGRDGHQFALPLAEDAGPVLPLRVWEFDDGLFVTAAVPPYEDLVGARITELAGRPIEEVLDTLEPLVPRDGPATVRSFRPVFLLRTDVLRGLGLIGPEATVELTLEGEGGERTVELEPLGFEAYVEWAGPFGMFRLPSVDDDDIVSVTELTDQRTLLIRYSQVQRIPVEVLAEVRERAGAADVERVVLDLRGNPGGDNHSYPALLSALQDEAVDVPGRLFVLTDRTTFSAASNLASEIERTTDATFVGEAMGGGINFWNDVTWVTLADWPVPMQVGVSTRYWEMGVPDDPRLTIEPDVVVPSRSADHFAGRDPVLEAALAE